MILLHELDCSNIKQPKLFPEEALNIEHLKRKHRIENIQGA
jgi:hypothetical protein